MTSSTVPVPGAADLARRFAENPLLLPRDIAPSAPGMQVECLLNPGAFRFQGRTWLLLRVAERPAQKPGRIAFPILEHGEVRILEFDRADPRLDLRDPRVITFDGQDYLTTLSHLRLVSSDDGIHFREEPSYPRIAGAGELESYGLEDCRVVQIGPTYFLTFTMVSKHGVGVGLRTTTDWRQIESHGMIFPPHNKDCAIFGEKIGEKYFALHRPSSVELGGNFIWLAESSDLQHWGKHRCVAHTRRGKWDSARIGAGASPIRTAEGWLEIYHGANYRNRYCLGALLLDLDRPWKVHARSAGPIMEPTMDYERNGFFGEVVFTSGHVVDGDNVTIYYGASDHAVCAARFSIAEILRSLR